MADDKRSGWRIEFWDFGQWDVGSGGPFTHKAEAVEFANELNRNTDHDTRQGAFCGHRYRVRWRDE